MSAYSPCSARPPVSVVIRSRNAARWLPDCLDALAAQTLQNHEVVVVDDGSTDDSVSLVRERYPSVRLIEQGRRTWPAAAANAGIRLARGEYIALLDTDTVPRPGWLAALVEAVEGCPARSGAVASKMLSLDDPGRTDDAGDALSWTGAAEKVGHGQPSEAFNEQREVFSVCCGAALFRRSFLDAVGGFDERFSFYLDDVDLCLRGRLLGFRYIFEPAAEVLHKGHGSGLPRAHYVRQVTRNRLMLFAKSVPAGLLVKHLPQLLYGQLYFLIAYRKPLSSLTGYAMLLPCIPHILRARRRARASLAVGVDEFDRMLTREMSEPPLRSLLRRRSARLRP